MSKKTSTLLAAALAAPLLTTSVFAVDVVVKNGNMDITALVDGNDVNPDTRLTGQGWSNYGYAGSTTARYWNPSAVDGVNGGNGTGWFDTSWGGLDASGNAAGNVLGVHTMQYDYRPAGAWFDDDSNRIWNMDDGGNTTDGSATRVEFRALAGGTPAGGTGTVADPYTYAADADPWTGTAVVESASVGQLLTEAFDATAKYTLTVQVGRLAANGYNTGGSRFVNPTTYDNWAGYEVELLGGEVLYGQVGGTNSWLAGGTSLAVDDNGETIAADTWGTSTITYTPGVSGDFSALNGQELAIRLGTKEAAGAHQNTMAAAFDNVVLTKIFAGDANEDDLVNGADANIWRANFGTSGNNWGTADFTGDGLVNGADANLWRTNFGTPAAAEAESLSADIAFAITGDDQADFLYDPTTGELSVSPDGESVWSINFTTDEDAVSTNVPANWAFADLGASLEWTDQSIGFFPQTGDFLLGTLATGLTAEDFGQVIYFTTADTNTNFGTVEIVPEPSSLALLGLGGLLFARRRRA